MNEEFSFDELDKLLLQHNGKIVHQIWFNLSWKSKKLLAKFSRYRHSWILKNPSFRYICWNEKIALELIKTCFPEYLELYKSYPHHIQRIDALRYFLLYRYGGFYADMDLECVSSVDEIRSSFPGDLCLVETGNKAMGTHVSNLFMFSIPNHPFWPTLFLELYKAREGCWYYTKHLEIMYTTGPAFLNRMYCRYLYKYKFTVFPCELFNPLCLDKSRLQIEKIGLHTIHYGEGSWESGDSKFLIFFYCNWKLLLFVVCVMCTALRRK